MERLAYTVTEFAEAIRVSETVVRELISAGEIPVAVIGKRRQVIPVDAARQWLNDLATAPSPPATRRSIETR